MPRLQQVAHLPSGGQKPEEECSGQSGLISGFHQYAALCYLLMFLCNWGVQSSLIPEEPKVELVRQQEKHEAILLTLDGELGANQENMYMPIPIFF